MYLFFLEGGGNININENTLNTSVPADLLFGVIPVTNKVLIKYKNFKVLTPQHKNNHAMIRGISNYRLYVGTEKVLLINLATCSITVKSSSYP